MAKVYMTDTAEVFWTGPIANASKDSSVQLFEYQFPSTERMKIILQHKKTGLYVKNVGEWTPEAEIALDFRHVIAAMNFATSQNLSSLDVLMYFGDVKYDIRLSASAC